MDSNLQSSNTPQVMGTSAYDESLLGPTAQESADVTGLAFHADGSQAQRPHAGYPTGREKDHTESDVPYHPTFSQDDKFASHRKFDVNLMR